MDLKPAHVVCIVGGGVAGSEAAHRLAQRGIRSVVLEMEAVPWGKIEWGLPKWHSKQRDKEEAGIDERLCDPHVTYVPCTKLGREIQFVDLLQWGFSAILLAIGAWRDRPLAIEGIDDYVGRGFHYQNPFVSWFNEYHSPEYAGPQLEICDGALVVGGGLASLDVVKILILETTLARLRQRGLRADLFSLEKKGIPKILEGLSVSWADLGLSGCTLYYRRRAKDMPLMPMDDDPTAEQEARARLVREKLLNNFLTKYPFRFEPQNLPVDKIVENDRLCGLVFQCTEVTDGKVKALPGTEYPVRAPLIISSIGSLPDQIPGLEMEWDLLRLEDSQTGKLMDYDNVFALGNAVTGRGNIQASRVHGREVSLHLMDEFLDWDEEDYNAYLAVAAEKMTDQIVEKYLREKKLKSVSQIKGLLEKAEAHQRRAGYDGYYHAWVEKNRPIRLEDMSG